MNGRTAKLLRKVAKIIGRDPNYIKRYFKSMTPQQQLLYRTYVNNSLSKLERKEGLDGKDLSPMPETNSSAGERK